MSNVFNIKRFCALVRKECRELPGKYGLSILSIVGGYMIFLILFMLTGLTFSPLTRMTTIMALTAITLIFAPSKLHGTVNHNKKGLSYVLLPVSSLEKTLSMFVLNSICTTFLILVGLFVADVLLYLIVPSHMSGFLIDGATTTLLGEKLINLFLLQSLFIFGNVLFKRHKVALTFISLIGIFFLLILFVFIVVRIIGYETVERFFDTIVSQIPEGMDNRNVFNYNAFNSAYRQLPVVRNILLISYSIYGIILTACWIGTYRLIKTAKY